MIASQFESLAHVVEEYALAVHYGDGVVCENDDGYSVQIDRERGGQNPRYAVSLTHEDRGTVIDENGLTSHDAHTRAIAYMEQPGLFEQKALAGGVA